MSSLSVAKLIQDAAMDAAMKEEEEEEEEVVDLYDTDGTTCDVCMVECDEGDLVCCGWCKEFWMCPECVHPATLKTYGYTLCGMCGPRFAAQQRRRMREKHGEERRKSLRSYKASH